eukprot:360180-Chlamydomonas_euryale.AAC.3
MGLAGAAARAGQVHQAQVMACGVTGAAARLFMFACGSMVLADAVWTRMHARTVATHVHTHACVASRSRPHSSCGFVGRWRWFAAG